MNKTELKNFAVSARRDLLKKVALRAKNFGIDEKNGLIIEEKFGQLAINSEIYSNDKKSAFLSFKKQLETKGYEQLIEEVAYTWFNRIIAIRFMEVNDYLPERVNVLSSSTGKVDPDILTQFETMDLNIDTVIIKDLNRQGETEEAYRQLFIAQCNALNKILPFMFEQIQDYTELLLPDFLLDSESVIIQLVSNDALTESFTEVEVIGWLYQFYNSEPKDKVFANLKKNKKIEKYDIPAATQLFTPKWIVQYMVENSLGQLWLESNPDSPLKESMRYYIEPAEQDEEVKLKLEGIRYKNVNLEEITIIDPCVGSGHILVYAFDLLYQMYEEVGYPSIDIPQLILEKNLYGLDIDDRSVQLASFTLIMKAREKSRRIFRKQIRPNIYSFQESNYLDSKGIAQLLVSNDKEREELCSIVRLFIDSKNLGSIIEPPDIDYGKYFRRIRNLGEEQLSVENFQAYEQMDHFKDLLRIAQILRASYDVAITNPPYMGNKGMNKKLSDFLKKHFPKSKSDLFAVFIERLNRLTKENAFNATINQHSWMFLSTYENLRQIILNGQTVNTMLHLGIGAFEELNTKVVQSTTYVLRNCELSEYNGLYFRLTETYDTKQKQELFLKRANKYKVSQNKFQDISGSPLAYWISGQTREVFKYNMSIRDRVDITGSQHKTANNDRFLRFYWEVNKVSMGRNKKWIPYAKGGSYRKWFGNNELVVDWSIEAIEFYKSNKTSNLLKEQYRFREGITWTASTNISFSCRKLEGNGVFDMKGPSLFPLEKSDYYYVMGYLNSKPVNYFLNVFSGTSDFQNIDILRLPFLDVPLHEKESIDKVVQNNISISEADWNSYETAPAFRIHPLLEYKQSDYIFDAFQAFSDKLEKNRSVLINNEEYINSFFINLLRLNNELSPVLEEKEVTQRTSNRSFDVTSFLSYFIGCVMGRYSLDVEGVAYAGGEWDESKYRTFKPTSFGLIHLTEEYYFENDIIYRLSEFLATTFSTETVEENLQWLAGSLKLKSNETAEERLRRYFLDEFFEDHYRIYQKCPIYWLVDSGKQKGLRTLIYMHRYQPVTMATIRFEHLQEIQAKYNNEIATVDLRVVNPNLSATEKRDLEKKKTIYKKRLEELLEFDKKLAEYANAQIAIDLDDGVKVNYAKFDKILAKIK